MIHVRVIKPSQTHICRTPCIHRPIYAEPQPNLSGRRCSLTRLFCFTPQNTAPNADRQGAAGLRQANMTLRKRTPADSSRCLQKCNLFPDTSRLPIPFSHTVQAGKKTGEIFSSSLRISLPTQSKQYHLLYLILTKPSLCVCQVYPAQSPSSRHLVAI
jgi:hypothetical protein